MRVLIRPLEISIGMQCQTCLSDDKRPVLYEKYYQKSLIEISVILRTIAYSLNYGLITHGLTLPFQLILPAASVARCEVDDWQILHHLRCCCWCLAYSV
jgi:hypothetical protein